MTLGQKLQQFVIIVREPCVKMQEEKQKEKEHEKALLECMHTLPQQPSIIVYPSPTAKAGRFECSVMSLSVLLDYRPEDNKEHSFEVSYLLFFMLNNYLTSRFCVSKWNSVQTLLSLRKCCILFSGSFVSCKLMRLSYRCVTRGYFPCTCCRE